MDVRAFLDVVRQVEVRVVAPRRWPRRLFESCADGGPAQQRPRRAVPSRERQHQYRLGDRGMSASWSELMRLSSPSLATSTLLAGPSRRTRRTTQGHGRTVLSSCVVTERAADRLTGGHRWT